MGGKKKKGGGKKKDKGPGDLSLEESNAVLEAIKESLCEKLIRETDDADRCKASENEKRFREMQLERKVKEEYKIQMDIISDMTRQYKSVEEEKMQQINNLTKRKNDNDDKIAALIKQKNNLEDEIKEIKASKELKITELKKRIEDMSADFASMLRETLDNMQNKINSANEKWESENDGQLLKRFEEYAGTNKDN